MKDKKIPLSDDLTLVIGNIYDNIRHHQKKEVQNPEYIEMMKHFADSVERAQEIIYTIEKNL